MKGKNVIAIYLMLGMIILFVFSSVVKTNPKSLATDSGFDSSWDSGSSSSSSYSSSSDFGSSSSSDSNGESVASVESKIFRKYFGRGFSIDSYLDYFGSDDYFEILFTDMFIHILLVGSLVLVLMRDKKGLLYFILTTLILIIFPTVLFVIAEFVIPGIIILIKQKRK